MQWFRESHVGYIASQIDFHDIFLNKWVVRKYHHSYLFELYSMRRMSNETIRKFNQRFYKIYHDFPTKIKLIEFFAMVYYTLAHPSEFDFYLRERRFNTL